MQYNTDTIAAIATPPGRGGVGIVRVSGSAARRIGHAIVTSLPAPRRAVLMPFLDGDGAVIDEGIVLWMPGPGSFTGEDVLELHGHGGPVVMDLLMTRLIGLGARPARPGEFSERAFLNDRLDLTQAEAIADLIDSQSIDAARAAARSLVGELSAHVHALVEAITELRVYVEAAIDFPEEEVDFLGDSQVADRLKTIHSLFGDVFAKTRQGALLREGMTVVIAGAPNAGKSSLLNRLAGYDAAIVTELPGTTRDVLREHIDLHGLPLHVIDTAGLRASDDLVEREGVRRAQTEMAAADRVLLVVDSATGQMPPASMTDSMPESMTESMPDGVPLTIVLNKIDLTTPDSIGRSGFQPRSAEASSHPATQPIARTEPDAPRRSGFQPRSAEASSHPATQPIARTEPNAPRRSGFQPRSAEASSHPATQPIARTEPDARAAGGEPGASPPVIKISAKTGEGLDRLRTHLEQCVGYVAGETGVLMARRRHLDALERARDHVQSGHDQLIQARAGELLAEELRLAQQALGEITGEYTSDDLLGRIFSSFCIGK